MKLLLVSAGLTNRKLRREAKLLLGKNKNNKKAIIISTKIGRQNISKQIVRLKEELYKIGINRVITAHISKKLDSVMIADCDLMYFGGGNTFYILDMIRKNKIDKVVKKFIKANKLYIGISAGALIPSPDISIAGWSRYVYDENSINLKNLKGLNIIGTVVMPHTNAKVITEAHDLRKRSKHKIVFISDSEAAVFTDYNKYYKI